MKAPSFSESLFSLKCFAAAMLALYVAMRIGLPRPFWALLTSYVVANPFSGMVRSKALYRVGGTVGGALATLLLVPRLAHAPELLSLALALWVGLCLYVSLFDRTPRSYLFILAGYTAALIGFPAVNDPASMFDTALARVEEITLGILCSTLVHSLVFPQSLGPALLARLDKALLDARNGIVDVLSGGGASDAGRADRRKLAGDITELRLMSSHLPFDTSPLRWSGNAVRAMHERLAAMIPLLSAVEDRLAALRRIDAAGQAERWGALLADIAAWAGKGYAADHRPAHGDALQRRIEAMMPAIGPSSPWSRLLELNLALRLKALVEVAAQSHALRRHIEAGASGALPPDLRDQPGVSTRMLHLDRRLAFMSALAAVLAILCCCAFWIAAAWSSGSVAAMMAAVFCCFFATQDDPVPGIMLFFKYTVISLPLSALYLLCILPAVHGFETLALACAPALLALGVYMARPATTAKATAMVFGFAGTLALEDTGAADLVSFINSNIGQLSGVAAAALITSLCRSVSADWAVTRLLRAGWGELARLGHAARPPSVAAFAARMLDRIGLLTPRLALAGAEQARPAAGALLDLRVGLNMTELQHIPARLPPAGALAAPQLAQRFQPLLHALSAHFAIRPARDAGADAALLDQVDAQLRAVCADSAWPGQRDAVAALTSIRRDLFPDAPPYQPRAGDAKEVP